MYLRIREKEKEAEMTRREDIERFFAERGVKRMQPWDPVISPATELAI